MTSERARLLFRIGASWAKIDIDERSRPKVYQQGWIEGPPQRDRGSAYDAYACVLIALDNWWPR